MSVEILYDREKGQACMLCTTTDCVFGPVMSKHAGLDAQEIGELFLRYCGTDPRQLTESEISSKYLTMVSKLDPDISSEARHAITKIYDAEKLGRCLKSHGPAVLDKLLTRFLLVVSDAVEERSGICHYATVWDVSMLDEEAVKRIATRNPEEAETSLEELQDDVQAHLCVTIRSDRVMDARSSAEAFLRKHGLSSPFSVVAPAEPSVTRAERAER